MSLQFTKLTTTLSIFMLSLLIGCYGSGETGPIRPVKKESETNPEQAKAAPVVKPEQTKEITAADLKKRRQVPSDELVERNMYRVTEPVLRVVLNLQSDGEYGMEFNKVEALKKKYPGVSVYTVPVESTHLPGTHIPLALQPTRAANPVSFDEEIEYSSHPQNEFEEQEGWIEYLQCGVDHFRQLDDNDVPADLRKQASDVIEKSIRLYIENRGTTPWIETLDKLESLRKQCVRLNRDPMFLSAKAMLLLRNGELLESEKVFDQAEIRFGLSDYPARIPVYVLYASFAKTTKSDRMFHFKIGTWETSILYWLNKDFRLPAEQHWMAVSMVEDLVLMMTRHADVKMMEHFEKGIAQSIDVPGWIRDRARADLAYHTGWMYRGRGFSSTVTENGWDAFRKYQEKADVLYQRCSKKNPLEPDSAIQLAEIGQTGPGETTGKGWAEISLERAPDMLLPYEARLMKLLPQWGGGPEEMIDFAIDNSQSDKANSDRPKILLLCFECLKKEAYIPEADKRELALNTPRFLKRLYEVVDELSQREKVYYQDRLRGESFFRTLKLIVALRLADEELIAKAEKEVGGELDPYAVSTFADQKMSFDVFRANRLAFIGASREDAVKVRELSKLPFEERMKSASELIDICSRVVGGTQSESVKTYFQSILEKTRLEQQFFDGGEVQLKFDPKFGLWQFQNQSQILFDTADSATIDTTTAVEQPTYLECIAEFPDCKVVSYDVELPITEFIAKTANEPDRDFVPQLATHQLEKDGRTFVNRYGGGYSGRTLRRKTNFGTMDRDISYGRLYVHFDYYFLVDMLKTKQNIRVVIGKHYLEYYFNGEFIARKDRIFDLDEELAKIRDRFSIIPRNGKGRGIAKISNIRIQKLSEADPPIHGPSADLVAYYQRQVEARSDDPWNQLWLGNALQNDGKHQEAIAHYKKALEMGISDKTRAMFWLGDALDHTGKYEEAYLQYMNASKPETFSVTDFAISKKVWFAYTTHAQWAGFRRNWYEQNRLGKAPVVSRKNAIPEPCGLLNLISVAQGGGRATAFDAILKNAPPSLEDDILERKRAVEAGRAFQETGAPLYLKFEEHFLRFPTLGRLLRKR